MLNFSYSSFIDAPIEQVWSFHERSDILHILTPPWQPVQVVSHQGGLEVGTISEFRLLWGVSWIDECVECERPFLFVNKQITGPMEAWTHRHKFVARGNQTYLTDSIDYQIPGGPLAEVVLKSWVDSRLRDMFSYRHSVTQQFCRSDHQNTLDFL
jgi:ligand-binding SRPBCC domain-containing protein